METFKLRAKFVKNNNSILIERYCKNILYEAEKGQKPTWIWWYEIDLDYTDVGKVADIIAHLSQKKWIVENYSFFVLLLDLYFSIIDIKKRVK